MKKILIALGFTMAAMSAQASTLSLAQTGTVTFTTVAGTGNANAAHDVIAGALGGVFGTLSVDSDTTFQATFLGSEAGNINFYVANGSSVAGSDNKTVKIKDTFDFAVSAGDIDFGFYDFSTGVKASNIGDNINKIAYISNDNGDGGFKYFDGNGNPFAFLIGFNDSGSSDGDYDDYVIGVNAVPVPAALPLMASALGMFGVARRKSKAKAV